MTPTLRLLATVEAGNVGDDAFCDLLHQQGLCQIAENAYHGSTDAAISLCEAMLPGVCWRLEQNHGDGCMASLALLPVAINGFAATPARALLIAVLRALVAKEGL